MANDTEINKAEIEIMEGRIDDLKKEIKKCNKRIRINNETIVDCRKRKDNNKIDEIREENCKLRNRVDTDNGMIRDYEEMIAVLNHD